MTNHRSDPNKARGRSAGIVVVLIAMAFAAAGAYATVLSGYSTAKDVIYIVIGYVAIAVILGGVVWGFHHAARQRIAARERLGPDQQPRPPPAGLDLVSPGRRPEASATLPTAAETAPQAGVRFASAQSRIATLTGPVSDPL